MKSFLTMFFDQKFWKFILVGIVNTLVGTAVMFFCFNLLHWDYWFSSAMNYVVGSVLSYFLNKHFTFQQKKNSPAMVIRFVVNISACYLIAYAVARPLTRWILSAMSTHLQDNVALLVGMGLFVLLNYVGQRFWAFREE